MAPRHDEPTVTWNDVAHWAEIGLITADQLAAIEQQQASAPAAPRTAGLNLLTISSYFGAFMVLLAYTFFVGIQWEALGIVGQLVITLGTVGGLAALGAVLRRMGNRLAGNLLIFAATGITPLLVYTMQRALGLWPLTEDLGYAEFYQLVRPQWLVMEVVSLAAALLVVWRTRFPLVVMLIAFWSWYLSMDVVRLVTDSSGWSWGVAERTVGIVVGMLLLASGIVIDRNARKDYSFWLYLFGNMIVISHLASLAFEYEGVAALIYLGVSITLVVASVPLQRRVFLVFGAFGCYSYLCYLAFTVFDGALGFVFALAACGLLIVLSGVFYQRVLYGWLTSMFGSGLPSI